MITEPLDVGFTIEELETNEISEYILSPEKYVKLFSSYLLTNELCSAKFLWRRIPEHIKSTPELQKVWLIGKALWTKQYTHANELINYKWSDDLEPIMSALKSRLQQDTLKFISTHYENIPLDKFQLFMGVDKNQAEKIVDSEGWTCENGYVIPIAISEPELGLSGSHEVLDRLITLSSFTSYIEN
ncbi:COP9 signalosome complex subunit 8-like [Daktulosphaira vitifoliae]|uniref:COP9 signalosome complex subunit 8-like n=1 Tax=Daktulosphaira vitifoliae TaxID=58002 RepID=UPI0021A99D85|nr:COP9 signalosome complex subunit 8-like [Daktulosphaira vitifoliae]